MSRSKPRYVVVSSTDRDSGTSDNFRVLTSDGLLAFKEVSLISVTLPNTIYNIRADENNHVLVRVGSTDYDTVLDPGAYSITTLTQALKEKLDANGSGLVYTVTYLEAQLHVGIEATGAFSLRFASGTSQANRELGFSPTDTAAAAEHESDQAVSLDRPYTLYITIPEFSSQTHCTGNPHDRPTFLVPVTGNNPELTILDRTFLSQCINAGSNSSGINSLGVRLTRPGDKRVDLNGADWSFVLEMKY